jgi:hypothetical protein
MPTICPPEKVDIINKDCVIRIIIQYFMGIDRLSVYTDLLLGTLEFGLLAWILWKTESYAALECSYYYYLLVAPFLVVGYCWRIIFLPIANVDLTLEDHYLTDDGQFAPSRRTQIQELSTLILLVLPIVLPTFMELAIGIISVVIKYAVTNQASMNDLYLIHYTPVVLSIIPLYWKQLCSQLPAKAVASIYDPYNFAGIAVNILVLLIGGGIGLDICHHYLR